MQARAGHLHQVRAVLEGLAKRHAANAGATVAKVLSA
jgi:hypothetical protein